MNDLHLTLAQMDLTVGDIPGNLAKIERIYAAAKTAGSDLVVCPELCIIGYPPEDLIFTPKLQADAMAAVETLAALTKNGPAMLVGGVWRDAEKLYNAAFLLDGGKILHRQYKHHLPNYGVFDEKRVFTPGPLPKVVTWRGIALGLLICEDLWGEEAVPHLANQKPDALLIINASPFEVGKQAAREALVAKAARAAKAPAFYLNQVGGQDELVFDGGSFAVDAAGEVIGRLAFFEEENAEFAFSSPLGGEQLRASPKDEVRSVGGKAAIDTPHDSLRSSAPPQGGSYLTIELLYRAMMTGLRDYVEKNHFPGVVIGLSGGIDSALTACVAVDALGSERVHCVMLPSPYTADISMDDAAALAKALGVRYDVIPITPGMEAAETMLDGIEDAPTDIARENIQSRLRGLLLMAISNSTGVLLITTGNKSEMATGYATLYGDMCGAFSVLKDVYKTEVFALAKWRNAHVPDKGKGPAGTVIPERTITRAPTAELRENQKDEDTLPPYSVLDPILKGLVEERLAVKDLVAKGFDKATVEKVAKLLYATEYKRRQAPPGVKLTKMAFGRDRRFPLTNRFKL